MSSVLGVRIHYPNSSTTELVKLKKFPATIGRALKNDVTLDHETISFIHAIIEVRDGHYFIRDLESTNGLTLGGQASLSAKIQNQTIIKVGDLELTFLKDEDPINDDLTREIEARPHLDAHATHLLSKTGLIILLRQILYLITFTGLDFYLNFGLNPQFSAFFSAVLISATFSLLLAFVCAFFSKLQSGRYKFLDILLKCNSIVILFIPIGTLWELFFFQFGPNAVRSTFEYICTFMILFFVGMTLSPTLFPKVKLQHLRIWVASLIFSIFTFFTVAGKVFDDESQHYDLSALGAYPLLPFLLEAQSHPDHFFVELEKIHQQIQNIRTYQNQSSSAGVTEQ